MPADSKSEEIKFIKAKNAVVLVLNVKISITDIADGAVSSFHLMRVYI